MSRSATRDPARSPNAKAAIAYLIASGATAISIIEHDGGVCSFRVGHKIDPHAISIQWVPEASAQAIVRQARRDAGLELAIVEANKLDHEHCPEKLQYIRRGAEAARILAEELARVADRLGARAMDPKRKAERAEFNRQMRDRIRLLAAERGLPESEIRPVISRLKHEEVMKFAQQHRVSYDWLLCGCLKGGLRMARWSR